MKKTCIFGTSFVILFLLLHSISYSSELYSSKDYLTGNWSEWRTKMHEAGMRYGLNYTAEPAALVSGGYEYGETYLHNINAELELDLDKLIGFPKTVFLAKYSSRSGDNLSEEHVVPGYAEEGRYSYGEYFNKSQEAFGGQSTKLVNFQFTSQLGEGISIDYGRLVMNDLYLRSDLYCNFMNNAICGSPKGVFTPYALNAYPDATMGLHVKIKAHEMLDLKLGVFDGGWTKQDNTGWDWTLGENGIAYAAEAHLFFDRAPEGGSQRVIKFGVNYHSGDFSNYKTGAMDEGQTSLWVLADWMVTREDLDPTQGLGVFGSYVMNTDDELAGLVNSFTMGVVYKGLITQRDRDKLGLMYTYADHSEYNTYTHDFVSDLERGSENLLELTYNFVFDYGIQIMPSVQYISNPNGSKDFDNVTVVGLKLSVTL